MTGAQLEMMRNMTQYLNRPSTYVEEYELDKYLTPDDDAFDDIRDIVADLEEKLMGSPNTPWGYSDTYHEENVNTAMPAGTSQRYGEVVPEGAVWRITGASFMANSDTCSMMEMYLLRSGDILNLKRVQSPVSLQLYPIYCDVTMKEGDQLMAQVVGMTLNDDLRFYVWGYKMDVPA